MRKASLKLLVVAALGLVAPLAASQQTGSAEACPYARAKAAAAAAETSSVALPVGVSLFDAAHLSREILP
jgi:hypothetical protein